VLKTLKVLGDQSLERRNLILTRKNAGAETMLCVVTSLQLVE